MAKKKKSPVEEALPVEETPEEVSLPPEPEVDLDSPSDVLTPAMAEKLFGDRKPVNKPDISRLPDALGPDGKPLFKAGDKIVIERYASCLTGCPYLDTRSYRVQSIDMTTGNVWLFDDSLCQHAGTNWKTAPRTGDVFKFAMGNVVSKKKRGRPRKNPIEAPKPVVLGEDGKPVKKKRGRPPGSKNRPKSEIKAEKAAKVAAKVSKKKKGG